MALQNQVNLQKSSSCIVLLHITTHKISFAARLEWRCIIITLHYFNPSLVFFICPDSVWISFLLVTVLFRTDLGQEWLWIIQWCFCFINVWLQLGAIHLWRPHGGGQAQVDARMTQWRVSSIWTSTQKIRAHWHHPVIFSCKEVDVFQDQNFPE